MRLLSILFLAVAMASMNTAHAAKTYAAKSLSYESAEKALEAAKKEAKQQERNVAIVIVDGNGDIIASARMDGARQTAFALAINKAKTALLFRGSSRTAMEEIDSGSASLLSLDNIVALPGGLAINEDGEFIGAIGVSGSPADVDEAIARAGLDRLQR